MKCNFYIHGVTKGQDVWGSEEDREYVNSFYSGNIEEQIRFVIEVVPKKNKTFYTYLRGKNVYSAENREGSYLGITIALEGFYCTDISNFVKLFDQIYSKCLVNTIISSQGGKERFLVSSFAEKSTDVEKVQKLFMEQIGKSFANDMSALDGTFAKESASQICKYSLYDVDSPSFFAYLKKYLKVYVSPDYATRDSQILALSKQIEPEKAKALQLSSELEDVKGKYKDLSGQNASKMQELERLTSEHKNLKETYEKTKNQLQIAQAEQSRLQRELETNKSKKNIDQSVAKIEQPLEELLRHIRNIAPSRDYQVHENHKHDELSRSKRIRMLVRDIVAGLSLVLLILLLINAIHPFITSYGEPQGNNFDYKQVNNEKLVKENSDLKAQITALNKTVDELHKQRNSTDAEQQPQSSQYSVDIKGYDTNHPLDANQKYQAVIKGVPNGVAIQWKADGLTITSDKTLTTIEFEVASSKQHVLSCYLKSDLTNPLVRRVLNVKE